MGGPQQPFLYESTPKDARFPASTFDPKAVTRASYVPKPEKPKQDGPLLSFNRHPDAHMVVGQRSLRHKPMSNNTKKWIKAMRNVLLFLRVLELNGAIGILVLMILISNIDQLTGWIMRVAPGVVMLHCVYGIYHLQRAAGGRTPGSSAAYHVFAGFSDLCVLPIYAYGVLAIRKSGDDWTTLLSNQNDMDVFLPAVYYTLIAAGGLHLLSLAISLWLGVMFRRISLMPPDMNPLESHLTSRVSARHKRNKSSVATFSTAAESEKRLSTPLEDRRRSGAPYETLSRPPSLPFMHTRQGSDVSLPSRDSRTDLPSRQYHITPGNSPRGSPRNSVALSELSHLSAPRATNRGSYIEVPLHEAGSPRPSNGTAASSASAQPPRAAKFTEAWYASESLINRTQQRNRALNALNGANKRRTYEALNQRYDFPESEEESGSDGEGGENENSYAGARGRPVSLPNPLRANPLNVSPRPATPYRPQRPSALSEVSANDRSPSGSYDIADEKPPAAAYSAREEKEKTTSLWRKVSNRLSSIQPEGAFYSRPYGDLKPATPPVMISGSAGGSGRQVSSGNDFDLRGQGAFARRNVSGKVVEEGRAGEEEGRYSYSRYSVLNGQ